MGLRMPQILNVLHRSNRAYVALDRPQTRMKHGGKRKGAGRKPTGRRPYLVRMKPRTMAMLKRAAKPKTVGEYMDATYAP